MDKKDLKENHAVHRKWKCNGQQAYEKEVTILAVRETQGKTSTIRLVKMK